MTNGRVLRRLELQTRRSRMAATTRMGNGRLLLSGGASWLPPGSGTRAVSGQGATGVSPNSQPFERHS